MTSDLSFIGVNTSDFYIEKANIKIQIVINARFDRNQYHLYAVIVSVTKYLHYLDAKLKRYL